MYIRQLHSLCAENVYKTITYLMCRKNVYKTITYLMCRKCI